MLEYLGGKKIAKTFWRIGCKVFSLGSFGQIGNSGGQTR